MRKRAVILGPHAGNDCYSIANYFNFCRRRVPGLCEDISVAASSPGRLSDFDREPLRRVSRPRAWMDSFLKWPLSLAKLEAEVFHIVDQGLAWYACWLHGGRRALTVHDLIGCMTVRRRLDFSPPPWRRQFLIRECMRQIPRMDHLIAASRNTADCLAAEFGIDASRISVIYHAVDEGFRPLTPAEYTQARRRWFEEAEYVVIHVGTAFVYKNRIGALKAFALAHRELPEARMFLVHGGPDRQEASFLEESGCGRAVRFYPEISRSELREFYGAAAVLIFPSLYEGFGWPPVEAMACGCPVVCTRCASLGEVVGDAAVTVVDPHDDVSLARELLALLKSPTARDDLRNRGLRWAARFNAGVAAAGVAEVYRRLC